jgi:hypothetical protein
MIELNMEENNSLDVVYEEARQRQAKEFSRIDALDTKTSIIIAASLVLLQPVISVLNIAGFSVNGITIAYASLFFLLLSLICSMWAIFVRSYRMDPKIDYLAENYLSKTANETKRQLVENYRDSISKNNRIGNRKASLTKLAFIFLDCSLFVYLGVLFCRRG